MQAIEIVTGDWKKGGVERGEEAAPAPYELHVQALAGVNQATTAQGGRGGKREALTSNRKRNFC